VYYAAKREPAARLTGAEWSADAVTVQTDKPCDCALHVELKNRFDRVIASAICQGLTVTLPACVAQGGQFRLEARLVNSAGQTVDCAVFSHEIPLTAQITDVRTDVAEAALVGDDITVTADIQGDGDLSIEVYDLFDRKLAVLPVGAVASGTYTARYTVPEMLALKLYFRAVLCREGYALCEYESRPVTVTPQKRGLDEFEVLMSCAHNGRRDFNKMLRERFIEAGVTGLFPGDSKFTTGCGAHGLGIYWYNRKPYGERKNQWLETGDKQYLTRVPCLNSPELWEEMIREIHETVAKQAAFGPVSYFANDEGSLTCYGDELELCHCPTCVVLYQKFLQEKYQTLAALNQAFGMNYASWEEVVPFTTAEALAHNNYAPWGAHRLFMEKTFTDAYLKIRDAIQYSDPNGRIRMSGCQASTPFTGYDYYLLHQYVGYFEAYGVGGQFEFHRSFKTGDTILGFWTGYGVRGLNASHAIWNALLHGLTLTSLFWQYSILNPDYTLSMSAKELAETTTEVRRRGIGKQLLYNARRDNLGIAVHYSMPSIHGSYIRNDEKRFNKCRGGVLAMLEDMGYQYDMLATQQIEAGLLKQFKVLFLPYSIALTAAEVAAIREFAAGGGMVIGDAQIGLMDENCRLYDTGFLDDVFGLRRCGTDGRHFNSGDGFDKATDFPYFDTTLNSERDINMAEIGIREGTGRAAFTETFMGHVKGYVVNEFQKGFGVYLNSFFETYTKAREQGGGAFMRRTFQSLLARAGVEKFATLQTAAGEWIVKDYETVYYSLPGNVRMVAVLRGFEDRSERGHDGLKLGGAQEKQEAGEAITVLLPQTAHLYDVRQGTYLGHADRIQAAIAPAECGIYAMLPFAARGLHVNAPKTLTPGGEFNIEVQLDADIPEGYRSTFCVSLYGPDGEYNLLYSKNVIAEGNVVRVSIPFALNDQPGVWKVVVRDVATGVSAEHTVTVGEETA